MVRYKNLNNTYSLRFEPIMRYIELNGYFECNGGTLAENPKQVLHYGDTLPVPTREGYTFSGWYSDPELIYRLDKMPADECVFYAGWKEESPSRSFLLESYGSGWLITAYTGTEDTVRVPAYIGGKPVLAIGENAFRYKQASVVVLPDTVRTISDNAFSNMQSLRQLMLPKGLTVVEADAFSGCAQLETVCFGGTEKQWNRITAWRSTTVTVQYNVEY